MGKMKQLIQYTVSRLIYLLYRNRLLIMNYHRVLNKQDKFFSCDIDTEIFDWQMSLIKKYLKPISLNEAIERLKADDLPRGSIVVTFDDGYKDNVTNALPVLTKYEIPATFFIATGFLNDGIMWNDAIIEAIKSTDKKIIDLYPIDLPICKVDSVVNKITTIELIIKKIKYKSMAERVPLIKSITELCEARLPTNLMMTDDDISVLTNAGMEIGGHTVNHPILTNETLDDIDTEIFEGKQYLENLLECSITSFAYPNGKINDDYTDAHAELVKKNAFKYAVTTNWGLNTQKSKQYQLNRFTPWDKTPIKFLIRILRLYMFNRV